MSIGPMLDSVQRNFWGSCRAMSNLIVGGNPTGTDATTAVFVLAFAEICGNLTPEKLRPSEAAARGPRRFR